MRLAKQYSIALIACFLFLLIFNSCSSKFSNSNPNPYNHAYKIRNFLSKDKAPKNDLERLNLKGKVKSTKQYMPILEAEEKKEGKKYEDTDINEFSYFNEVGYKVQVFQIDPYGTFINKCYVKHNKNGQKIEVMCYAGKKVISSFYWKYNEKGQLIEEENSVKGLYLWGGSYERIVYIYNDKDQVERVRTYDRRDNYQGGSSFEYDEQGNIQKEIGYDASNKKAGRIIFDYDERNNLILEKKYRRYLTEPNSDPIAGEKVESKEELWIYKNTYEYNEKDQVITTYNFENDSVVLKKLTYVYDELGNELEKREYRGNGRCAQFRLFTYDDAGNLMLARWYAIDPEEWTEEIVPTLRVKYELDEQGNWVKQNRYYSGKLLEVIVREIVYY